MDGRRRPEGPCAPCAPHPTCCRKGEWSEVSIPMSRFLLTWRGRVVESEVELNAHRITSLGVSLAGGEELQPEGPFRLGIEWVAAQNSSVPLPPPQTPEPGGERSG